MKNENHEIGDLERVAEFVEIENSRTRTYNKIGLFMGVPLVGLGYLFDDNMAFFVGCSAVLPYTLDKLNNYFTTNRSRDKPQ